MKTIKKYWWLVLILIVGVVIVVMGAKIRHLRSDIQLRNVELSTLKDSVNMTVTKNGHLIAKVNSVEVEKSNLKESLKLAGIDIKSLKDENIKWRNLNGVLKLQVQSLGTVQTHVTDTFRIEIPVEGKPDTIRYQKFDNWSDGYFKIWNGRIENRELFFNRSYQTGIQILPETTRNKTIVTIKLDDPLAKITNANSLTIVNKKKFLERPVVWSALTFVATILIVK